MMNLISMSQKTLPSHAVNMFSPHTKAFMKLIMLNSAIHTMRQMAGMFPVLACQIKGRADAAMARPQRVLYSVNSEYISCKWMKMIVLSKDVVRRVSEFLQWKLIYGGKLFQGF